MRGIKNLLCVIAVVLIMMGERGIPIKLQKGDWLTYGFTMLVLWIISTDWT